MAQALQRNAEDKFTGMNARIFFAVAVIAAIAVISYLLYQYNYNTAIDAFTQILD
jgi:hypothetical protein